MSGRPGFFIPYRYAASTQPCDYSALEPIFAAAADRFAGILERIEHHGAALSAFGGEPPAPRFEQDWFPRLDACAAYAMVRDRRPARIVEIGCGHSTRVMARAIVDGALCTDHLCIDPAPRARLEGLHLRHLALPVDRAGIAAFSALASPLDIVSFTWSSAIFRRYFKRNVSAISTVSSGKQMGLGQRIASYLILHPTVAPSRIAYRRC